MLIYANMVWNSCLAGGQCTCIHNVEDCIEMNVANGIDMLDGCRFMEIFI